MVKTDLNLIELVNLMRDNSNRTYVSVYDKFREGTFFQNIEHLTHSKYLDEHWCDKVTRFHVNLATYDDFQEREVDPFCKLVICTEPVTEEEKARKIASYDAYDKACFINSNWQ